MESIVAQLMDGSQWGMAGKVLIAMTLGGLIGWERELSKRTAGLRTNIFVAGAACLLVTASQLMIHDLSGELPSSIIRTDPVRIVEAVITGISFIAAGSIIRGAPGNGVQGLTTAATLLMVASLGITVAISKYLLALLLTALSLVINIPLRGWENRWLKAKNDGHQQSSATD